MATQQATVDFILKALGQPRRFSARAMFGEYALYADGRVVALICDDQLYVKITEASRELDNCDRDSPYPGAKPHYVVEEARLSRQDGLARILLGVAQALPVKKSPASKNASALKAPAKKIPARKGRAKKAPAKKTR